MVHGLCILTYALHLTVASLSDVTLGGECNSAKESSSRASSAADGPMDRNARRLGSAAMLQTRNELDTTANRATVISTDFARSDDAHLQKPTQSRRLCAAFHDCPATVKAAPWPWREVNVPRRARLPDVVKDREPFVFNVSLFQPSTRVEEHWTDLAFVRNVFRDAPLRVRVIPRVPEEDSHHHHVMNPFSWSNESWESTATLDEVLANWGDVGRDRHLVVYHTDVQGIAGLRDLLPFPKHYFGDDLPDDQRATPWGDSHFWMMNDGAVTQLHHDAPDNFIHVLSGNKEVLLFPPQDAPFMYRCNEKRHHACGAPPEIADHMSGVNLFSNIQDFPLLQHSHPHRISMHAGEVLWLPSKWFHLLASRGMQDQLASRRDPLASGSMFTNMWFCHPHNQLLPEDHPSSCPKTPSEFLRSVARERERVHYAYQPDEKQWSDSTLS